MSPEALNGEYDTKTDIWSLGISLIECVCKDPPYYSLNKEEAIFRIVNERPIVDFKNNYVVEDFVYECTQKNARKRPNAEFLLSVRIRDC